MHVETLKEWWENADQVAPMRGDLVIENVSDEDGPEYRIRKWPGDRKEKLSYVRVLEPRPKPAWHDAVAVIAHTYYGERRVWERDSLGWYSTGGDVANTEDLRDVTPLIEAKVTDEAMQRVFNALDPSVNWRLSMTKEDEKYVRHIVAAALGLETR